MNDTPNFIKFSIISLFIALLIVAVIKFSDDFAQSNTPPCPVWLGVQVIAIDKTVAENFNLAYKHGLLVRNVITGSPAEEAGIIEGDIIRRIGDKELMNTDQLKTYLRKKSPERKVRIVYIRDGITITAYATLEISQINDQNTKLVYGAYSVSSPPTNKPYPYFYFGEGEKYEPPERE